MKKLCFICSLEKSLEDFYKHKGMDDGHLGKCKECCKLQARLREEELRKDPKWLEKERERARNKYYRLGYKDLHKPSFEEKKKAMNNHINKYPEKYLAKIASQRISIEEGLERHHWSYRIEDAKDIIPLDKKNHSTAHRFLIYDQERMQYRTLDGILLDTKEAHLKYINSKF